MNRVFRNLATGVCAVAIAASGGLAVLSQASLPAAQAAVSPTQILPTPQEVSTTGVAVPLTGNVKVSVGTTSDPAAKSALEKVIKDAGGTANFVTTPTTDAAVYLGTTADNPSIAAALTAVESSGASALAKDGYVIATGNIGGKPALVLDGKDATGSYYAVQSLGQVVSNGKAPSMTVKDWPLMSIRGAIEGFYGIPWSHEARLDQFDFYGKHKMNTYIYTPKDDDYLRGKWRDLYPQAELAKLKELVARANANHVNFTFALSPGNDVCYSDDTDMAKTLAKFDQLRSIGVSSFYIALDDINPALNCAADKAKFTASGFLKLADGQAFYLNRIVNEYIKVHNLQPLQTVPTNYNGSGPDPYKGRFGQMVDKSVLVQWTGEGVFSNTITEQSVIAATSSYNTDHLYIWDNLPVNDGQRDRIFLNPLEGRDVNLYKHIDGITSNPMIEPYSSMIALAGFGDYSWNSPKYVPATTQSAIIKELAGSDAAIQKSLEVFVDLNQGWKPYRPDSKMAPALSADVAAFWTAYQAGNDAGMLPLRERLATIKAGPATLANMAMTGFYTDSKPWIDAAAQWATALDEQIKMLQAIKNKQGLVATDAILAAVEARTEALKATVPDLNGSNQVVQNRIVPSVGDGVFGTFYDEAIKRYNTWLNLTPTTSLSAYPATATSSLSTYSNNALGNMVDGKEQTLWWSSAPPVVGSSVTVDLGSVKDVGKVVIQQADSDTQNGDMFYNARVEYSVDGQTYQPAGTFNSKSRIEQGFETPVQARYVRMVATAANPGNQWVKVREFAVFPPATDISTNVTTVAGSSSNGAFDVKVESAFEAASLPDGAHLTRTLEESMTAKSIAVVGTAAGELQVQTAAGWVSLGQLNEGKSFQEAALDSVEVTGVRLLFTAAQAKARAVAVAAGLPVINELGLRSTGVVADDALIGEAEPTPSATASESPTATASPTATESTTPEPSPTASASASASGSATFSESATASESASATGSASVPAPSATATSSQTAAPESSAPGQGGDSELPNTGFAGVGITLTALVLIIGGFLLQRRKSMRH